MTTDTSSSARPPGSGAAELAAGAAAAPRAPGPRRPGIRARRAAAAEAAAASGGVLHRETLRDLGFDADAVANEIWSRRWRRLGRHTVLVRRGEPDPVALRWRAVWESGANGWLDGVSALAAAGCGELEGPVVHVGVPLVGRVDVASGVLTHRVRHPELDELAPGPLRSRVDVAAIRAAHWAGSDEEAEEIVRVVVGHGWCSPFALATAAERERVEGGEGVDAAEGRAGLVARLVRSAQGEEGWEWRR